jgi:hypothetical protein
VDRVARGPQALEQLEHRHNGQAGAGLTARSGRQHDAARLSQSRSAVSPTLAIAMPLEALLSRATAPERPTLLLG